MSCSMRVAVADDEPVMQMYLEEVLGEFGHEVVVTAGDGVDLVAQFEEKTPDLIVTDIKMPRMDGIEALRQIYHRRPVPVVLITGYNDSERVAKVEQSFVLVYLVKPVGERELRQAIVDVTHRFKQFEALVDEGLDMGKALAVHREVYRTARALAARDGVDLDTAFERIRALARERGATLSDAAATLHATLPPVPPS